MAQFRLGDYRGLSCLTNLITCFYPVTVWTLILATIRSEHKQMTENLNDSMPEEILQNQN